MDKDLKAFSLQWARVVAMTLATVMFVAFTSIPYSLGWHPGELVAADVRGDRHMT
jgi:hypothetical protein